MKQIAAEILFNAWVSPRYKHMAVRAPEVVNECLPGQFFHLRCGNGSMPLLRRPMSIYRIVPERGEIHFLYLVNGVGTIELANMVDGAALDMMGPLGRGFMLADAWTDILVLARGVGLATLAPLVELASKHKVQTHAILSARTHVDVLSKDYMESFGASVYTVTDEDGTSDTENVESMVRDILDANAVDAVFTCGARRLTDLLQRVACEKGIPGQVALEENMGCGIGMCYCCVKPFRRAGQLINLRVCSDGPVFPIEEVVVV